MADQTQQMRDLVRAVANGCPLDTAPDWVWRAYLEAMRTVARDIMATDHNADGGVMASGGEVAITIPDRCPTCGGPAGWGPNGEHVSGCWPSE